MLDAAPSCSSFCFRAPHFILTAYFIKYCGKSKASLIFALQILTDKMPKHIVSYPISSGKLINAIGFVSEPDKEGTFLEGPAVMNSTTDVVSSFFTNWSDEARCIIDVRPIILCE